MSQALEPVQFEVNFVDYDGAKVIVSGRNYEQDIFINDVFEWVYYVTSRVLGEHEYRFHYSDERSVSLRVEAIEFARHDTDILGHGSTGRLTLLGDGAKLLKPAANKPFSYDLLRIERLMQPLRPIGLAEEQFVVPDDFDDPLPEELQRLFEGHEETMS